MLEAEDDHPQPDTDLRRGKTGALGVDHRFVQVADQRQELLGPQTLDRSRALEEARITHEKNRPNHGASCTT